MLKAVIERSRILYTDAVHTYLHLNPKLKSAKEFLLFFLKTTTTTTLCLPSAKHTNNLNSHYQPAPDIDILSPLSTMITMVVVVHGEVYLAQKQSQSSGLFSKRKKLFPKSTKKNRLSHVMLRISLTYYNYIGWFYFNSDILFLFHEIRVNPDSSHSHRCTKESIINIQLIRLHRRPTFISYPLFAKNGV